MVILVAALLLTREPMTLYRGPVSLTIGDQNAIKSCRWSSSFTLSAVLRRVAIERILERAGGKRLLGGRFGAARGQIEHDGLGPDRDDT